MYIHTPRTCCFWWYYNRRTHARTHSVSVKQEMKQYYLQYLDLNAAAPAGSPQALSPFVATSLIQLLCRTVKLGWFEADSHRALLDDARRFLEKGSVEHYLIGAPRCAAPALVPARAVAPPSQPQPRRSRSHDPYRRLLQPQPQSQLLFTPINGVFQNIHLHKARINRRNIPNPMDANSTPCLFTPSLTSTQQPMTAGSTGG